MSPEVLLEVLPGPRRRFHEGHPYYVPRLGDLHEAVIEAGGRFHGAIWTVDAGDVDELELKALEEGLEVRVL